MKLVSITIKLTEGQQKELRGFYDNNSQVVGSYLLAQPIVAHNSAERNGEMRVVLLDAESGAILNRALESELESK